MAEGELRLLLTRGKDKKDFVKFSKTWKGFGISLMQSYYLLYKKGVNNPSHEAFTLF